MTSDYASAFAAAVAREISAEMGRQGIHSMHAMARKIGTRNHVSINDRLNLEPKSGKKPIVINVVDLATYCRALGVEPAEIIRRAQLAVDAAELSAWGGGEVDRQAAEIVKTARQRARSRKDEADAEEDPDAEAGSA